MWTVCIFFVSLSCSLLWSMLQVELGYSIMLFVQHVLAMYFSVVVANRNVDRRSFLSSTYWYEEHSGFFFFFFFVFLLIVV